MERFVRNSFDNFCLNIADFIYTLKLWFAKPLNTYCELETVLFKDEKSNILVTDNGSLITVLELQGVCSLVGKEEFADIVEDLKTGLTAQLKGSQGGGGHLLQVFFNFNPDTIKGELEEILRPSRETAKNLNLDVKNIDIIFDDIIDTLENYCNSESIWVVLWTFPTVLPQAHAKKKLKEMYKKSGETFIGRNAMMIDRHIEELIEPHLSYCIAVKDAFKQAGLVVEDLDNYTVLNKIRQYLFPEYTSVNWKPLLPGDPLPKRLPAPEAEEGDFSDLFYPSLKSQLFPTEGEVIDNKYLKIGNYVYCPIVITLPPQTPKPFDVLFNSITSKGIPFRMMFNFYPQGLSYFGFKTVVASIIFFGSNNKRFNNAIKELEQLDKEGECLINLKMTLLTWVKDTQENWKELLSQRVAQIIASVQNWGVCDATNLIGDPLLGVISTTPALFSKSPAPSCVAPLEDAVSMLPITRPVAVWEKGSLLLRSPDGKIFPYSPGSQMQSAWIDIGVAPMGQGKSVFLNALNFAFVFQPGLTELPYLSIIDIGLSSSGLINLVRSCLPDDLKYLAVYKRLKNTREFAVNPFDTPLGVYKPLPAHKAFLINLLGVFATPLDATAPPDGISGIANLAIDYAYEHLSPNKNPKVFVRNINPYITKKIDEFGYQVSKDTTWWDIVEYFFKQEKYYEASVAQRYAVPLLDEVMSFFRDEKITSVYKHKTPGGETITEYFWRTCFEAINNYPILAEPTQFDVGEARIISLDLDEVTPKGGSEALRQAGVMFMLARYLVASKFFLMPKDIDYIPELYRNYHAERIKQIRRLPKRLCYDEFHRVSSLSSVVGQIIEDLQTCARESRKWNLHIGLYSQTIKDYPEVLLELATSVFMLGYGTKKDIETLGSLFGLNNSCKVALSKIRPPDRRGSNMVAFFKTKKGKITQFLTATVGKYCLWAFASGAEDTEIRNALYEKFGVAKTLYALAKLYPGGLKEEVEKRRQKSKLIDVTEKAKDVMDEIIEEISEYIIKLEREGVFS